MLSYHAAGMISSGIFVFTMGGLVAQLRLVWRRRREFATGSTDILSLNQFLSSFFAFFALFLYGAVLRPINPYLVWPRLAACSLVLLVLFEMARDRRDSLTMAGLGVCIASLFAGLLLLGQSPAFAHSLRGIARMLVVAITVMLGQGYLHQVWVIRQSGKTGAVSIRMHQLFLVKDVATVVFGCTMGWKEGWPVFLLSSVSAATKIVTLWHFRWVRTSPLAIQRRGARLNC